MRKIYLLLVFTMFFISFISATIENNNIPLTNIDWDAGVNGIIIHTGTSSITLNNIQKNISDNSTRGLVLFSNGTVIQNVSFVGSFVNFTTLTLNPNQDYIFAGEDFVNSNNPSTNFLDNFSVTYPIVGTSLNWIKGYSSGSNVSNSAATIIAANISSLALTTTLQLPSNSSLVFVGNNSFNATLYPNVYTLKNATIYLWYTNGTFYTSQTNTTFNSTNGSSFSVNLSKGVYLWNVLGVQGNGVGINSSFATNNYTLTAGDFVTNSVSYDSNTYETSTESFSANVTTNGFTPSNGNLNYAGSTYPLTVNSLGGNNYNLSSTIQIPTVPSTTNNTFNFSFTLNGVNELTSNYNQTVSNINLTNCMAANSYVNFSFEDELNQSQLNASIATSTFNYWLGTGSVYKTLSYSTPLNNSYYAFCLTPQNLTLNMNYTISYGATSYATRTIGTSNLQYTNITTNNILYLLLSSSGQIVTFQVVNSATQPLLGVFGNATKVINGVTSVIGSGISGADGGIPFFLDPLTSYTFTFSLNGYNTFTETVTPTQTGYTVTLGGSSSNATDYTRGISQLIQPSVSELSNSTVYLFNYSITSTYWTLQNFSFILTGNNGTVLATNSSVLNGGLINANVNTSNYTSINMTYTYYINGVPTTSTVTWIIFNNQGTGYSILNFFTDLKAFFNAGFFGANPFALTIIIYLIIFISTGFIAWKSGYTSPGSVITVFTGLVIIFDIPLGFDSFMNPVGVTYFPSILMAILVIAMAIRENLR